MKGVAGRAHCTVVQLKLSVPNGVHSLTMKKQIKINPASFILGALIGGFAIFTIAADSQHSAAWEYRVVEEDVVCVAPAHYNLALAKLASTETNGWESVSAQIVPNPSAPSPCIPGQVFMVQRRAKQ